MTTKLRTIISSEWFLALLVSAICFAVYFTTMCRTVSFIDAGELATVASLLGIAHPTGYPLFTLLSHCWLWLPLGGEEVVRLNLFSAAVTAASVGVFFRTLLAFSRMSSVRPRKERESGVNRKELNLVAAAVASLVFGLSTTVWSQSVAIEVYGLHLFLLLLTILFFLQGIERVEHGAEEIPRQLVAAVFLLGMSFANHLTTLLIIPALVYLYVSSHGLTRAAAFRAAKLSPFFLLGLSPYLYLPLRAGSHPPQQWGFPAELERLFWHVSGKQYRNWMFSSFDSAEKQLTYFFNHFTSEFNWLVLVFVLLGVGNVFRSSRRAFWFLVAALLGCIAYSINYDIYDIDSYFLLAYVVAGVCVFFGTVSVMELISLRARIYTFALFSMLLVTIPVTQYLSNRREVNEADNFLVDDYTHNIFANAEKNAVIISYQWDYFVASSLYFQLVRKERPDLVIIDKELLRRSWYFILLKDRFPWLIERSKAEVAAFLSELEKFEHDRPYDPGVIEGAYVAMINSFITRSMADHPVYVGPEIEPEFGAGLQKVPSGLLFRVSQPIDTITVTPILINYRPSSIENRLTIGIRGLYARMLTATAMHLSSGDKASEAKDLIEKALSIDPTFRPAISLREQLRAADRQVKR